MTEKTEAKAPEKSINIGCLWVKRWIDHGKNGTFPNFEIEKHYKDKESGKFKLAKKYNFEELQQIATKIQEMIVDTQFRYPELISRKQSDTSNN